jgi:ammonia channel protein AmtB
VSPPTASLEPYPKSSSLPFQMTFAIITPALIVGTYIERANFALTFSTLWMPLCRAGRPMDLARRHPL